ncbi:dTDP-4-dehydrorhamnose 3,5-epimerase [Pontibacter sp. G13]|uniref:dTDP-4-dehydrorhamnose 3,5-epimerase n=1 Tax=Pontibacter sp. G13 TaxID=3074898 RepID=UPI00288A8AEE|nr:dTDP-4-dehydrorhamnose 3,5-epimerase [Pontibacter sp. G13]WNJ16043.1 dTDP-4-dehydrorhamnose 3,5-epimerase [Pontibacter sp. G13]
MGFRRLKTSLQDVYLIEPKIFGDDRGFFLELYNANKFKDIGLGHLNFVQDNLSFSRKGALRGLHFQRPPHAQGKLVSVLQGKVLDVAVDLRKNSPTFGQSVCVELDSEKRNMLYIPEGFAHGFQVISDECLFLYKCTNFYHPEADAGLAWDDPTLNIPWLDIPPVLSQKDQNHPHLAEFDSPF